MTERKWPALSAAERELTIQKLERWVEQGFCQPKLEPSLLGLDWDYFSTREFSERARHRDWIDPPEFTPITFSMLDAYAAAILSSAFAFEPKESVSFRGRLTRFMLDGPTKLEIWTSAERWPLAMFDYAIEIHRAFRDFLDARGFDETNTWFTSMEGPGCPLSISYPGRLISQKSSLLRERPVEEWPCASLSIQVTEGLRSRAREVLAFIRNSPEVDTPAN